MKPQQIQKFMSSKSSLRATVCVGTEAVREMQSIQNTFPLATMAVGRSMMAAALLACNTKEKHMISLYFKGQGPLEMVFAEATFEGEIRGYTPNPNLELPLKSNGELDLESAIGPGTLVVVNTQESDLGHNYPHRAEVQIKTGEIGDDVAFYLQQSAQVPAIVSLGVKVNAYGKVEAAGGVLIELMPGHTEQTIKRLELALKTMGSLSERIHSGQSASEIANEFLKDFEVYEIPYNFDISYRCRCSKKRLLRSIDLLSSQDLKEIIEENDAPEAMCEFCGRKYNLTIEEVEKILSVRKKQSLH